MMICMDHLDQLLDLAGSATEIPPPPEKGIPRQKLPGFIRWPIRVLMMPFVVLDLWIQGIAKKIIQPPFKQVGTCKKRGNCCHFIMLQDHKGWKGALSRFWNFEVLGFFKRSDEPYEYEGKPVLIMGCRYLKKDGSCGQYRLRPAVCRKWPMIEYFGMPRRLKGCGFRAVPRGNANIKIPEGSD
jgi:Fe-S-cluster containining protein